MTKNEFVNEAREMYNEYCFRPINESAHDEWALYREKVTDFILSCCEADSTLAIYGAGRCDDIDTERICNYFSEVVLVDLDAELTDEALKRMNPDKNNVSAIQFDLTGLEHDACQGFIEFILERHRSGRIEKNATAFAEELAERARTIYRENFHPTGIVPVLGKQYDYSVVLGVHSQLNNVLSGLSGFVLARLGVAEDIRQIVTERIEEVQRSNTAEIVKTADDIILDATVRGIVLGFEYEVHRNEEVFTAVDGAVQCAADFEQLQRDGIVRCGASEHLTWNIDKRRGLEYDMLVLSFMT